MVPGSNAHQIFNSHFLYHTATASNLLWRGPQLLLWNGCWDACLKLAISGKSNSLCDCVTFAVYTFIHRYVNTRAIHKETELFLNLFLYLQLNQTFRQSTPLHSWYTAPNVFSPSSGTRPGTCFAGWREGPLSNFLLSPLPSETGDLLVRILTSWTRKSPQGPNMESRATGGTTVVSCFVKNSRIRSEACAWQWNTHASDITSRNLLCIPGFTHHFRLKDGYLTNKHVWILYDG